MTGSEPTFWQCLVCKKWSPYVRDMSKNEKVGLNRGRGGSKNVDAMLTSVSDEPKFDNQTVVKEKKSLKITSIEKQIQLPETRVGQRPSVRLKTGGQTKKCMCFKVIVK